MGSNKGVAGEEDEISDRRKWRNQTGLNQE